MFPNIRPKRSTFVFRNPRATTPAAIAATVKTPTAASSVTSDEPEARAVAPATANAAARAPAPGGQAEERRDRDTAERGMRDAGADEREPPEDDEKRKRAAEDRRDRPGGESPLKERERQELAHALSSPGGSSATVRSTRKTRSAPPIAALSCVT